MSRILHIDASARGAGSLSREIGAELVRRLAAPGAEIVHRDLAADPPPFVHEAWVGANFTRADERSPAQREALAGSDALVDELVGADVLVLGVPVYNFGIPAVLKAWIDQVGRVGRTFRYTANGPEGLSGVGRAYLAVASGGTAVGSEIDFATPYLRHVLGFLGVEEVEIVAAAKGDRDAAFARLDSLLPTAA